MRAAKEKLAAKRAAEQLSPAAGSGPWQVNESYESNASGPGPVTESYESDASGPGPGPVCESYDGSNGGFRAPPEALENPPMSASPVRRPVLADQIRRGTEPSIPTFRLGALATGSDGGGGGGGGGVVGGGGNDGSDDGGGFSGGGGGGGRGRASNSGIWSQQLRPVGETGGSDPGYDPGPLSAPAQGKAVQVEPMKPVLTPPGSMLLKLRHDGPLSNFAFDFNVRRYSTARGARTLGLYSIGSSHDVAWWERETRQRV